MKGGNDFVQRQRFGAFGIGKNGRWVAALARLAYAVSCTVLPPETA
jgi:hypothetical protein